MRVLWFTNVPCPDAGLPFGGTDASSGGWMWALASALREHTSVEFGVATACRGGNDLDQEINGTLYYRAAVPKEHFVRVTQLTPDRRFIDRCQQIVAAFKPDLVHIHGTEQTYGLLTAQGHIRCPTVISLQGVISAYFPHYLGGMTLSELRSCHGVANAAIRQGIVFEWLRWKRRVVMENVILRNNRHFVGRTLWDRSHLQRENLRAVYHSCDEVLRPPFYKEPAKRSKNRFPTIFAVWGGYPLKGTHVLIKALSLVKRVLPNVRVRFAGGKFRRARWAQGYWSHLDNLISAQGISDSVVLLPPLDANEYAREVAAADVFALPSFIENSPNSLCEAMLVGTPCVASYVGGVPSLVRDEDTALCFPPGEHSVLAQQLIRVLTDGALAARISRNARELARTRHDPRVIANRMIEIYSKVLEEK